MQQSQPSQEMDIEQQDQQLEQQFVVPRSKIKLRACQKCHLIKPQEQWKKDLMCENCGFFKDENESTKTTDKFDNLVSILDPSVSWIRKRIKLPKIKLVSGAYAVNIY